MTKPPSYNTKVEDYFLHSLNEFFKMGPPKKTPKKAPRPKRKRSPEPPQDPSGIKSKYEGKSKSPERPSKSPKLSTARFWSEKAANLEEPPALRRDPRFSSYSPAPIATPTSSPEPRKFQSPKKGPLPLSNDAIADILRKTKPNCPQAQAWVQAHEISKAEMARTQAQIEDRQDLRRKIANRLRDKARAAAKGSGAPKGEIKEFLEEQQVKEETMDSIPEDEAFEEIEDRVLDACWKLQQTMFDLLEFKKKR